MTHAVWATLATITALLLVLTGRQGHPPAVIFLPVVLLGWAVGHVLIWATLRLAAAGRAGDERTEGVQRWPPGLLVAVVGTGAATLAGVIQLVGTVPTARWYPFGQAGVWLAMLVVWVVHAACFAGLLLRRHWSRLLSASLAFGWATFLAVQVAVQLTRGDARDVTGMLTAVALVAVLLLFGFHLLRSGRVKSFLGNP